VMEAGSSMTVLERIASLLQDIRDRLPGAGAADGTALDAAVRETAYTAVAGNICLRDESRIRQLLAGFPPLEMPKDFYVPTPEDVKRRTSKLKQSGMVDVTLHTTSLGLAGSPFIEVTFETRCGAVLRYRLERKAAIDLFELLGETLQRALLFDQKLRSSGMPSCEGSPNEGQNV